MSLINDALKRVKQAQQQNPFGGSPSEPLQPVEEPNRRAQLLRSMIALLALITLACSGWFFWKWWRGEFRASQPANVAKIESPAQLKDRQAPRKSIIVVSTNIVVRPNPAATLAPLAEAASTNAPLTSPQTQADAPAPPAEPAAPPSPVADLKLRSIIYREGKPAAVINGDMLYVGDEIRGARVVRIDRHTVTVERKGETNQLQLPRL